MKYSRHKNEPVSHIDDWLMTYADMITLLLCFFIVFLFVSVPRKNAPQKPQVAHAVEQTAKPPDMLEGNLPFHGLARADRAGDKIMNYPVLPPPARAGQKNSDITVPVTGAAAIKTYEPLPAIADTNEIAAPAPLDNVVAPPPTVAGASSASLTDIVARLKSQGPADIEQKGDRITTLAMDSAAFFASGSATLSDAGKSVLREVAANIRSDKFKDYQVTVEGHTDDAPIKTPQFPSNWELSTARAAAVVHFFLDQGIPAQRLRAAGYADTFPVAPNRDADGKAIPENQARNRRVVIKLEKIEKTQ